MGQSLSSIIELFQIKQRFEKKSYMKINNCPYCNDHYGKHLSNHMKECPFKGISNSVDRFIPGTNQRHTTIFSHGTSVSHNKQ